MYNFPVKSIKIVYLLSDGPVWDVSIGFFGLVPVDCFCLFLPKGVVVLFELLSLLHISGEKSMDPPITKHAAD